MPLFCLPSACRVVAWAEIFERKKKSQRRPALTLQSAQKMARHRHLVHVGSLFFSPGHTTQSFCIGRRSIGREKMAGNGGV